MKNSTAFAAAGLFSLFAWGAAFAQSPSQIPVGAGTSVTRQPAGSRFRTPPNAPPAVVAPVPVAVPTAFSWTGVYVGGDFGGSFASTSIASATTGWASRSLNPAGVMGGAYAGYNYQVSPNFVVGLEGDFQGNSSWASFYYPVSTSRRGSSSIGLRRSMVVSRSPMTAPCSMRLAAAPGARAV
jgi:opacity protein-like surface antigen